jgi:hypothetical protein
VVVPVPQKADGGAHASAALVAGLKLHTSNNVTDPETGIRVSVGLVRWNRVRSTRAFARHLATCQVPDGVALAFACYHAKHAMAVRNAVYGRISGMLTRKCDESEPDPLLRGSDIRRHLHAAAVRGETDLVCFVSSTNILEAGCDLDADWGVTEPCSERSFLQFAGRVRRHRTWAHPHPNLGILDQHVPVGGSGGGRLEKPGVETPVPMGGAHPEIHASLGTMRSASHIFPLERWKVRVDTSGVLTDYPSPSGKAEVAILDGACSGIMTDALKAAAVQRRSDDRSRPPRIDPAVLSALSVRGPIRMPAMAATDLHPRARRFRRQDGYDLQLRPDGGSWLKRDATTVSSAKEARKGGRRASEWRDASHVVVERPVPLKANQSTLDRLLLPLAAFDIELAARAIEQARDLAGEDIPRWMAFEIRAVSLTVHHGTSEQNIYYDDILGFDQSDA